MLPVRTDWTFLKVSGKPGFKQVGHTKQVGHKKRNPRDCKGGNLINR